MSAQDPFSPDPIQPQQRLSGRKLLADALKNFVFSFSQGLAAQSQYPGRRGSQAGMAAAIGGPALLQQIEEQRRQQAQDQMLKLETFRQQVRQNQLQQALSTLNAVQGSQAPEIATAAPQASAMAYPGQVGQGPTMGGGTQQTPLPLRQVNVPGYGNVQPISAQQAAIAKMNELRQAAAIQAENRPDRFSSSPQGIFDTGTGQITAPTQKTDYSSLVQAVMQNPDLFGTLSDTIQAAIAPTLTAQGFKMPTDYTPESITVNGKGPIKVLRDKRGNYVDATTKKPIQGTIGEYEKPAALAPGSTASDPKDIAEAIIAGEQPPLLTGLYRNAAPIRAELARRGFNLAQAQSDWNAIQKHIATLNSNQQERLRQAMQFTAETLPQIEAAYQEWKKQAGVSGFKILNRAALASMKQLSGPAGSAATNLDALISDFTSELGTVYKGGNGSTDESLQLAAKNLNSDWNERTFNDAVSRLRQSLAIRRNSIVTSAPAGISPNSIYLPAQTSPVIELERGPDGKLREKK